MAGAVQAACAAGPDEARRRIRAMGRGSGRQANRLILPAPGATSRSPADRVSPPAVLQNTPLSSESHQPQHSNKHSPTGRGSPPAVPAPSAGSRTARGAAAPTGLQAVAGVERLSRQQAVVARRDVFTKKGSQRHDVLQRVQASMAVGVQLATAWHGLADITAEACVQQPRQPRLYHKQA